MQSNVVTKLLWTLAAYAVLLPMSSSDLEARDRAPVAPPIEIGSPDLLRNDETTVLAPLTPAKALVFTGTASACSTDTTISLDKGDPANCASSTAGEGARTPTNGSDDLDDFYISNFTPPGSSATDTDSGLLADTSRPLIYYQIENACDDNGLLMVKNLAQDSVDIYLDNAVACPVGACCDGAGLCSDGALEYECVNAGGTYQGDASDCSTVLCAPQSGACCTATACLDAQTQADCTAAGGTYQGDGTDCIANPCPPSGACCTATACLDAQTPTACAAAGGTYQGDGTDCIANPCPPTGACCSTTGCLDAQTQTDCTAAGGTYQGDGTDCIANPCTTSGACCTSTACLDAQTQSACTAAGGTFQGNGTACATSPCTGACCEPVAGCIPSQTQAACLAAGGTYQGNLTICGPTSCGTTGACCSPTQPCADGQAQNACVAAGGIYQGDTTTCAGSPCTGACCNPGQQCSDAQTQADCVAAAGVYQGDTTLCATSPCAGACCVPGTGCVDGETNASCQTLGGTFQGNLTTCAANPCTGACCDQAGACTDGVLGASCTAGGGVFQGDATDCINNPCIGACCSPNFGCNLLTATACDQQAGSNEWLGTNTVCGVDPCPAIGACCGVFGCGQQFESSCAGTYVGDGVSCTPNPCVGTETGACCDDVNDTCTDGTLNSCTASGGRFVEGDICDPNTCDIGACCSASFPCAEGVSPEACDDLPGSTVHAGDNTTCADCPPTGACCGGVFGCSVGYEATCTGTYAGDGTVCTPQICAGTVLGACCDDAASTCSDVTEVQCAAAGDRFIDGDTCGPNTCDIGACCSPLFPCVNGITPDDCFSRAGARVHLGDGTVCGVDPCPPTGACCSSFGFCQLSYATSCSGTYLGDGTDCSAGCP